jgi:hypothetical protein
MVEKVAITDGGHETTWSDAAYRLKLSSAGPIAKGIWNLKLRPAEVKLRLRAGK